MSRWTSWFFVTAFISGVSGLRVFGENGPSLISVNPANGSSHVAEMSPIVFQFDEPMDPFELFDGHAIEAALAARLLNRPVPTSRSSPETFAGRLSPISGRRRSCSPAFAGAPRSAGDAGSAR